MENTCMTNRRNEPDEVFMEYIPDPKSDIQGIYYICMHKTHDPYKTDACNNRLKLKINDYRIDTNSGPSPMTSDDKTDIRYNVTDAESKSYKSMSDSGQNKYNKIYPIFQELKKGLYTDHITDINENITVNLRPVIAAIVNDLLYKHQFVMKSGKEDEMRQFLVSFFAMMMVSMPTDAGDTVIDMSSNYHQVAIAIAWDMSGSFDNFPPLKHEELFRVIDLVSDLGGSIGIALITENSFQPILRRRFDLDTVNYPGLILSDHIRAKHKNDSILTAYEHDRKCFADTALELINAPRDSKITDLAGMMSRLELYFNEIGFADHERIAILVTDAKHTAPSEISGKPDAEILLVGASIHQARNVFGDGVNCFESFGGLLDYLQMRLENVVRLSHFINQTR